MGVFWVCVGPGEYYNGKGRLGATYILLPTKDTTIPYLLSLSLSFVLSVSFFLFLTFPSLQSRIWVRMKRVFMYCNIKFITVNSLKPLVGIFRKLPSLKSTQNRQNYINFIINIIFYLKILKRAAKNLPQINLFENRLLFDLIK